jgi:hypothetical protein
MKQVPDRKKLRREYIENKQSAYVQLFVGSMLLLPSAIIAIISAIITVIGCLSTILARQFSNFVNCLLIGGVVTLFFGLIAWMGSTIIAEGKRLKRIPYVPPVSLNILPAEEILVRASEKPPVTQSEVLLRAAQKGQETPKEELLRVKGE